VSAGARRGLGVLAVLGGVVLLLLAAGSVVAAVVLSGGSGTVPSSTFAAGETVTAPDASGAVRGPLVVYGADVDVEGSRTLAVGCEVVSGSGTDRVVTSPSGSEPVQVDGRDLVPVVEVSGWRPGDQVTCTGDQSAALEPLALGVTGAPATATVVAGVLAVVAVVVGVLLLVVGARALRSR